MNAHQHVLIVEDDVNDAYFIRRAFEHSGVTRTPHICKNAPDAIQYLEGAGEYANRDCFPFPSLLLTDLKMVGGGGFELLEWLRDHPRLRVVPTVVMSSSSIQSDVDRAYCLGVNAYLCKPADQDSFRQMFSALLRFWEFCEVPETRPPSCEEFLQPRH